MAKQAAPSLFEKDAPRPLAERMRPGRLDQVVGQDHLLGEHGVLGRMVGAGRLASHILWGPPGCGKTTIARLLASHSELEFEPLSAVFSGVGDLRKIFERAHERRQAGQGTMLFVDEIHRFNRAQQDAFLPVVEDGTVALVGATTDMQEILRVDPNDPSIILPDEDPSGVRITPAHIHHGLREIAGISNHMVAQQFPLMANPMASLFD